jgi:glutamyl-tRNA synthetase
MENVRVRFAPSPTGGLHLGGIRTVLYNYLFAKKHGGTFILRIEDTDQNRYVEGAESYIMECLSWCGLEPDESTVAGGAYGPYRQSERKPIYAEYAQKLVNQGNAYYAFDTPEELDKMRAQFQSDENPAPQYDVRLRMKMNNSLTCSAEETKEWINAGKPYVIRLRVPDTEEIISFNDMIRGEVSFTINQTDDKVLLKADGMPTYHLAVVVDDYLMKISHAFRGEEWLPSAPAHLLLWKFFGWEDSMPQWAHLPLILKPDGHGKLSKRDGDLLGFPVFAMNWTNPKTSETSLGFRERGFLPEAFINLLAALGWHSGTEQEIFTIDELIQLFNIERVHKGGAKFDFEKAKWYNQEWIKRYPNNKLVELVKPILEKEGLFISDEIKLNTIIGMVKERCVLLSDFIEQSSYFFRKPLVVDLDSIQPKWNQSKLDFFNLFCIEIENLEEWSIVNIEKHFKELAIKAGIKPGELQLPFRIMLVGGKFGPTVFDISYLLGKEETIERIKSVIIKLTVN